MSKDSGSGLVETVRAAAAIGSFFTTLLPVGIPCAVYDIKSNLKHSERVRAGEDVSKNRPGYKACNAYVGFYRAILGDC